nr:hypothetical protein [Tanacetum cinerariifolium]
KTSGSASSITPPTPIATSIPTTTVVTTPRLSAAAKETTKIGEQKVTESDKDDDEATESDRESKDEETREQEEETSQLPTPPTQIPSLDLQSLPTFASVFRFEDKRPDEQQNLYKALVEAYDADKTILDTYGESTILKQRREDDDQEGPSAGSDRGSKRPREEGAHASASTLTEPATGSAGRTTTGSQSRQLSASESALAEEPPSRPPTPDHDWNKSVPAAQGEAQSWISALTKQTDARSSF